MQIRSITFGTGPDGQRYEFTHDGSKAVLLLNNGQKWQYMSRATIASITKMASQMGIKWDNPGAIRELYNYRVSTKSDRVRKAIERDIRYAPYRTLAQMAEADD